MRLALRILGLRDELNPLDLTISGNPDKTTAA